MLGAVRSLVYAAWQRLSSNLTRPWSSQATQAIADLLLTQGQTSRQDSCRAVDIAMVRSSPIEYRPPDRGDGAEARRLPARPTRRS